MNERNLQYVELNHCNTVCEEITEKRLATQPTLPMSPTLFSRLIKSTGTQRQ